MKKTLTKLLLIPTMVISLSQTKAQEFDIGKNAEHNKYYTILTSENFSEGFSLVGVDIQYQEGEMNYGYGEKLYGFINQQGEYVIMPKYEKAFSFSNGFALVTKDSHIWEFVNTKGVNVFNKYFSDARSFSEGFAAVRIVNESYGFINTTGEFISKPQYEDAGDFKEGVARVKFQKKWGFIDKFGKEIIYPQFAYVYDFQEGLAATIISSYFSYSDYGFINKEGKYPFPAVKIKNINYKIKSNFINGYAIIAGSTYHSGEDLGFGFISKKGKAFVSTKYWVLENFYEGLAAANNSGFIDSNQKWVIKPVFQKVGNFSEGLARVSLNDNWGFIDIQGNVVINKDILNDKSEIQVNPKFDEVSDFSEGYAIVKIRNKFGYIDKHGEWFLKPELIDAKPFKNGLARVKFADRKGWNFIDKSGKLLFVKLL